MRRTRRWFMALPAILFLGANSCGEPKPLPPVQLGNPDSVLSNPPEPPVIEW